MIEMVGVLAVIGVIVAIAVPAISKVLRDSRVTNVNASVKTLQSEVSQLQNSSAAGGSIPITEGAVTVTGAALSAQGPTVLSNAARLDQAMVSAGIREKLVTFKMGSQIAIPAGTGGDLTYSTKLRSFIMDDGTGNPSASLTTGLDYTSISRVKSRISNPTLAPSAAAGANFRLNGTGNISSNSIVAYVLLKDVPYKDAVALSKEMNGEQLTTASTETTTPQDAGPCAFAAPAVGATTTDVYIYLTSI